MQSKFAMHLSRRCGARSRACRKRQDRFTQDRSQARAVKESRPPRARRDWFALNRFTIADSGERGVIRNLI